MCKLMFTLLMITGAGLGASGCAEEPRGSGCFYNLITGELAFQTTEEEDQCPYYLEDIDDGSPDTVPASPTTAVATSVAEPTTVPEDGVPEATTPTTAAPASSIPDYSIPDYSVPDYSIPVTTLPELPATSTSTTAPPASTFTAVAVCRTTSTPGVVVSGTGTPGASVSFATLTPYQWYYSQPPQPVVIGTAGTFTFEMTSSGASYYPFAATLVTSLDEFASVAVATC